VNFKKPLRFASQVRRWIPLLIIGVLWVFYYHCFLIHGEVYVGPTVSAMVPSTAESIQINQSYQRDKGLVLYPQWHYLRFLWKNGYDITWNPYFFSGTPFWPLSGRYDPIQLLTGLFMSWLSSPMSYMVAMMCRSALALIFFYALYRHYEKNSWNATAGVIGAFLCAPILVTHLRTFDPIYLWALMLLAAVKLWDAPSRKGRIGWAAVLSLGMTAEFYTSQIHMAICFGIQLVVFFALLAGREYIRYRSLAHVWERLIIVFSAMVLAALASCYSWLPFLELSVHSYRTVIAKPAGGLMPYFHFGVFYFPNLLWLNNALTLFNVPQRLQPIAPSPSGLAGVFEDTRIAFFLLIKSKQLGIIESVYRSPIWYLLLGVLFIEPKTRRQAFPFWATYLAILLGYNALAITSLFFSMPSSILTAVNWLYVVVVSAQSCLAVCFGFGAIAALRLAAQWQTTKVPFRANYYRLLLVATGLIIGWLSFYLWVSYRINAQARPVSDALRQGLVRAGLDETIGEATGRYVQWRLQETYNPLPTVVWGLIIVTVLSLAILWVVPQWTRIAPTLLCGMVLLLGIEGIVVSLHREDRAKPQELHPDAPFIEFLHQNIGQQRYLAYGKTWTPRTITVEYQGVSEQTYDIGFVGLIGKSYPFLMPATPLLFLPLENLDGTSSINSLDYRLFTYGSAFLRNGEPPEWQRMFPSTTEMSFPFYKSPAFDVLRMKYLVTQEEIDDPDYPLVFQDGTVRIYENRNGFPPAWLVSDAEIVPDRLVLLERFSDKSFDPKKSVLLETEAVRPQGDRTRYGLNPIVPQPGSPVTFGSASWLQRFDLSLVGENESTFRLDPTPVEQDQVVVESYRPGQVTYRVKSDANRFLVLSEVFYPGWKATADGTATDIYRANYTLMAVPVEAGEHIIELSFEPDSYTYTRWISFAALLLTVGLLVAVVRRSSFDMWSSCGKLETSLPLGGGHQWPR
jgi:hypothetical protein